MTDENLMMMVADGDTRKLGDLYNRYHAKVYDYFSRMTNDHFLSSDLLQTVFEKALKGKHTYREQYPFVGWIFRIAKNVLMDHYRKNKRTEEVQEYNAISFEDPTIDNLDKSDLEIALDQLDEHYREVLLLTRFEDLKYKEVAAIVGISETGVKTRVRRAIAQLRENYLKVTSE
ncbi:MAG: RNA polymerase sigma factor [Saprospiraceae bacterium]|nr:RNA polymerase sigma factor [Saprospiraceae bacterium]